MTSWRYHGNLKMQRQPNRWSCVPTAFAMCIKIDVDQVIAQIGHDGSAILYPDRPEPFMRRAFYPEELYPICYKNGYIVTEFYYDVYYNDGLHIGNYENFINSILPKHIGVLGGKTKEGKHHCVAWDGKYILDPMDLVYTIDRFTPLVFYLITKRSKNDTFSEENEKSDPQEVSTGQT